MTELITRFVIYASVHFYACLLFLSELAVKTSEPIIPDQHINDPSSNPSSPTHTHISSSIAWRVLPCRLGVHKHLYILKKQAQSVDAADTTLRCITYLAQKSFPKRSAVPRVCRVDCQHKQPHHCLDSALTAWTSNWRRNKNQKMSNRSGWYRKKSWNSTPWCSDSDWNNAQGASQNTWPPNKKCAGQLQLRSRQFLTVKCVEPRRVLEAKTRRSKNLPRAGNTRNSQCVRRTHTPICSGTVRGVSGQKTVSRRSKMLPTMMMTPSEKRIGPTSYG